MYLSGGMLAVGQVCMRRGRRYVENLCTFCSISLWTDYCLKERKSKTNKQKVHKADWAEASLFTPQLAAGNAKIVKNAVFPTHSMHSAYLYRVSSAFSGWDSYKNLFLSVQRDEDPNLNQGAWEKTGAWLSLLQVKFQLFLKKVAINQQKKRKALYMGDVSWVNPHRYNINNYLYMLSLFYHVTSCDSIITRVGWQGQG